MHNFVISQQPTASLIRCHLFRQDKSLHSFVIIQRNETIWNILFFPPVYFPLFLCLGFPLEQYICSHHCQESILQRNTEHRRVTIPLRWALKAQIVQKVPSQTSHFTQLHSSDPTKLQEDFKVIKFIRHHNCIHLTNKILRNYMFSTPYKQQILLPNSKQGNPAHLTLGTKLQTQIY